MPELLLLKAPPLTQKRKPAWRCDFTRRGHPTTAPGTPADEKRIRLSQWLTRLIGDGDAYATPGADGYTAEHLADAEGRYAHLREAPARPEAEVQLEALGLLRAGVKTADLMADLDIPQTKMAAWRQNPRFLLEWEAAKAEGQGRKVRSSAVRDSAAAARAPAVSPPPVIAAAPMKQAPTSEAERKALALEKLRAGTPSAQVIKQIRGLDGGVLAEWRKDAAFAAEWNAAKAAGRAVAGKPARAAKPAPVLAVAPVAPAAPLAVIARPALGIMPRLLWREQVEQERLAAMRDALHRYLDHGDALPAEWVEEYNELAGRFAEAA